MSETLGFEQVERSEAKNVDESMTVSLGQTGLKTVFETLATPVEVEDDLRATGPTQRPTHMGGQFIGIDQDRDT